MRLLAFLTILATVTLAQSAPLTEDPLPSVLLILVDDMGFSDLSCYGSEIQTPNIDALANNGLRMTQFYNAARCCPTRASLLTGLYPHQAGMGHQNQDRGLPAYRGRINETSVTIAEVLQENGYATYQVGKWHVGNTEPYWPRNKGFQQYLTLIEGAMSYYNNWPWGKKQDTLMMRYNGEQYHPDDDFFATTTFSDTASAFIRRHSTDQPFFMYLAYNAPHWPLHATEEDQKKYEGYYDNGWEPIRQQRFAKMKELGLLGSQTVDLPSAYDEVPEWNALSATEQQVWSQKMELYAAVMHRLDIGIGQVVASLRETDQLDNTLIVLLSDNGASHEDPNGPWVIYPNDGEPGGEYSFPAYELPWANVSNTPFRLFKSYLHEGGIRTPLIAHWPDRIAYGGIDQQTVGHIIDVMPSILDLADVTYPSQFKGRTITPSSGVSLLSAWQDQLPLVERSIFWEHQYNRAVRRGAWKLVSAYKPPGQPRLDTWELYNLDDDPTELTNLADEQPDRVAELEQLYRDWAVKVGALSKSEMNKQMKR